MSIITLMVVKFKFQKVDVFVVVTYSLSEGDVEESETFWNNMNNVLQMNRGFRLII